MVEEQRLHRRLQQVHEVVAAADVRELVGEHELELRGGEADERARGNQDDRTQPAQRGRHLHQSRLEEPHGGGDPKGLA
jgi:hypothetical protein